MTRAMLPIAAGLAWFMLIGLAATLVASTIARAVRVGASVRRRPSFWLALRLLPSAAGVLFVAAIFVPAFQRFEPAEATEAIGLGLGCLAATALIVIGRAAVRGAAGWRRAARQARAWLRSSDELSWPGVPVRVHCVRHARPAVSLIGVLRPRLFVTRPVVDALTPEELQVVVAHEIEHRTAWDNLKRLAMLAAPDVMGFFAAGPRFEAGWAWAVESDADRRAAGADPGRRLILASAILKVARLMPAATPLPVPVSELYSGGPIAARIEMLTRAESQPARSRMVRWAALGAVALAAWCATSAPVLHAIHHVTEFLVGLGG